MTCSRGSPVTSCRRSSPWDIPSGVGVAPGCGAGPVPFPGPRDARPGDSASGSDAGVPRAPGPWRSGISAPGRGGSEAAKPVQQRGGSLRVLAGQAALCELVRRGALALRPGDAAPPPGGRIHPDLVPCVGSPLLRVLLPGDLGGNSGAGPVAAGAGGGRSDLGYTGPRGGRAAPGADSLGHPPYPGRAGTPVSALGARRNRKSAQRVAERARTSSSVRPKIGGVGTPSSPSIR